ncbi:MAG: hypothetical protein MI824_06830 [Hyphomicrobiales bacterium]|nr:hypothetical protein [Hyphomicrobiales bacterium]
MHRCLANIALTLGALGFFYWLVGLYDAALRDPRLLDGWILAVGMVVQLLFHVRKKFPALTWGRATTWMKAHTYMGYFVIAVFVVHTGASLPDSAFEWSLWTLFVLVVSSGVVGAYLSWSIPAKLERNAEELIFERIPAFRFELAREAHDLAIDSINHAGSLAISDLYSSRLHAFFQHPQNLFAHLRNSRRPLQRICDEIESLERYVDEPGRETLGAIKDLVVAKDDLDFQYAHMRLLQTWLFLHIPATYGLVVLSVVHIVVVIAFSSGVP